MSGGYYLLLNNLNEQETKVVKSLIYHISSGKNKVSITKIAQENFVSTSFIVKLSKKMGFEGYSDLYYHLQKRGTTVPKEEGILNYCTKKQVDDFCNILYEYKNKNGFVIGAGFAEMVAAYIVQRLAVCGFMIYNRVHFYDFVMFQDEINTKESEKNIIPTYIIAISQSGETDTVVKDVLKAKEYNYKVISFTSKKDSTLAKISDICFLVDQQEQVLTRKIPNMFFAQVMTLFELLLCEYVYENYDKHDNH